VRLWRIVSGRHPVWSAEGARRVGGRWNAPGQGVVYAALAYSTAMLEVLVHANAGAPPAGARYASAEAGEEVPVERLDVADLPGWDAPGLEASRAYGRRWWEERRSAVLLVPSVVTKLDWNAVVNPEHPAAAGIAASAERPVSWDARLFRAR
jgi:RES domain-containing protein